MFPYNYKINFVGAFFSYLIEGSQPSVSVSTPNHDTLHLVGRQWWPIY